MSDPRALSCYLIGSDTLLAQCGEMLLERGHAIRGVITASPVIQKWAADRQMPTFSTADDYAATLVADAFDYLFAITHLALIPPAAVQAPKRMAINFHDGPLPAYAGLNAPMWALANGETSYAISWHAVAPGIDTGDILLQHPVAISDDDTALSLNTKCFAAALESFPILIDQLARGAERRVAQDASKRSYFARDRKPAGAGVLDWRRPAVELERQVRALNTGNYSNPVAAAKLLVGSTAVIVESARSQPADAAAPPGRITSLDDSEISIATGDGSLRITALRSLDGRSVTLRDFAAAHRLAAGDVVPVLTDSAARDLAELAQRQGRYEPALTRALERVEALDVPYRESSISKPPSRHSCLVDVPPGFAARAEPASSMAELVAGAFVQTLGRMLGTDRLQVAVSSTDFKRGVGHFDALFAAYGVAEFEIEPSANAWAYAKQCAAAFRSAVARGPWLRDLVARQPSLHGNRCLQAGGSFPVAVVFGAEACGDLERAELVLRLSADGSARLEGSEVYSANALGRLAAHLAAVMSCMSARDDVTYRDLDLVAERDRAMLLGEWNATALQYDRQQTIHAAFAARVRQSPEATAVVCGGQKLSYAELDASAERIARRLSELGVVPNALVGVHVPRSIELVIATLGVLKSGGAYVPLDPAFPKDRLEYMIADSAMKIIVSHSTIAAEVAGATAEVVRVDELQRGTVSAQAPKRDSSSTDLAYVIYTSGSTGRPKGVMIEHRSAINFFAGMDRALPYDPAKPGTWLAVTSLSFDISVLELLWTLTRGFTVVVHDEARTKTGAASSAPAMSRRIGLGLFMWGNDDAPGPAKYRLLMEGARYFDENGFDAVWTPERHFHAFGGPYPNPAVTGAAVAAVTSRVKIRAGSCVVPLHHPIRIAEEWAVVDNLSNGRVEIAAASGWNPNDFVLKPENHAKNKDVMLTQLEQVRRLWRGETLSFPGPLGKDVEVQSLPRPVQAELPCWITTAGNPDTWRAAGQGGFHVLTHLLGQTVEEVGEKIRVYREARAAAGFDPDAGQVALMLHTFVGEDDDEVRELVRKPMKTYLASSMRLAMNFAWSFPAFKRPGGQETKPEDVDIKSLSAEEIDTILDFAFDRYFSTSGLFGTVDSCLDMLRRCSAIGVTEIACLLDFGVETDRIMQSLPLLKELRARADADLEGALDSGDYSFAGMVRSQRPTHMQCTPSMARMYLSAPDSAAALRSIPHILLGGEALPVELVRAVNQGRNGTLTNMYGPTETTIWSTTHRVANVEAGIPIGRPIANTRCYVLDKHRRLVPIGMVGELYIGGDGVARGYLNRPELTEQRFVPDPFAGDPAARMYATGDLARYRSDGEIEYIGRADFQVKIRGYRIELGEIEALLEARPEVAEAAVIVRAETAGDLRLVGFVVGAGAAVPDAAALKAALREKLPDYMVPAELSVLPAMPRTANGKLDRKALMALRTEIARVVTSDAVPQDDLQKTIAQFWQQVLKVEKVGIDDNFFDLGGHSLLVVQLHNQLKKALTAPLSLTDLYQYPTIRTLSGYLSAGRNDEALQKGTSRGAKRRALRSRSA
jgi:natural product biosynthesis luciferase-like monooxygenase protein